MPTIPFLFVPREPGYVESSYWVTDILKATDGSETRKQLLTRKKYKWSFTVRPSSVAQFSALQTALRYIIKGNAYIPLWLSYSIATTQNNAGIYFNCDTTNREYVSGDTVITVDTVGNVYEVRVLTGVDATYLAMTTSAHVYPITTSYVVPVRIATIEKTNAMNYQLPSYGDVTIDGEEL
jgi:hypothetical protein